MTDISEALGAKTLIYTVTSGRSGTGLLTKLLKDGIGIATDHEPPSRINFVLRALLSCPDVTTDWLVSEKLPAVLARATSPEYAETSHLVCKGLIEPLLSLGLRPKFIVLRRRASDIALSLFQMSVIPERTSAGRLVLLGPTDDGVLPLPDWQMCSDYQLCFWYALEIERRQRMYATMFKRSGIDYLELSLPDLLTWNGFVRLSRFVRLGTESSPDQAVLERITSTNQNFKETAGLTRPLRPVPNDIAGPEGALLRVTAQVGAA